jgi:hypothetical protein
MALQKIFLLPPLKGLNLYDNPFTMSQDYAVELVNFMPPTTTFTVRPGITYIKSLSGQVKGLYSYTTGTSYDYGKNWYDSTIKYGASRLLLIKLTTTDASTSLYTLDVHSKDFDFVDYIFNNYYNEDSALANHTLFLTSGSSSDTMYLYHQSKGFAKFCLQLGADQSIEVGNIQNITIFRSWIFLSTSSDLNLYYIKVIYADIFGTYASSFWNGFENLFSPHYGKSFTLEGIVQNGGSILKLVNISKSGSDSISTYLAVITDNGEVLLFDADSAGPPNFKQESKDADDPDDIDTANLKLVGRFQVSPPLNKWSFVDMEGDLVIATHNGLVSLRRIVFGQTTQLTENLEYRLMSLFSEYMFKIPAFVNFIGLYYHSRNRLLIFNVPTDLPIPFNQLANGYPFNKNKQIMFTCDTNEQIIPSTVEKITNFVKDYILPSFVSYSIIIHLDNEDSNNFIFFIVKTIPDPETAFTSASINIDFGITLNNTTTPFISQMIYNATGIGTPDFMLELTSGSPSINTKDLKKLDKEDKNPIYSFRFPNKSPKKNDNDELDYIVSSIECKTTQQIEFPSILRFEDLSDGESIFPRFKSLGCNYPFFLQTSSTGQQSMLMCEDFYKSSDWGIGSYSKDKVPNIYADLANYKISPLKVVINSMARNANNIWANPIGFSGKVSFNLNKIWGTYFNNSSAGESQSYYLGYGNYFVASFSVDGSCQVHNDYSADITATYSMLLYYADNYVFYSSDDPYPPPPPTLDSIILPENQVFEAKGDLTVYINSHADTTSITSSSSPLSIKPAFVYPTAFYNESTGVNLFMDSISQVPIGSWTGSDSSKGTQYIASIKDDLNSISNDSTWNHWGYLLDNNVFFPNASLDDKQKKPKTILKNKGIKPTIVSPKKERLNTVPIQKSWITNVDLSAIPLFDNIDIVCDYKSTQYVFDSHFGTWSSFKGINMMKGIEHDNDFYFVVPDNITYETRNEKPTDYVITQSTLYKFDINNLGDEDSSGALNPIEVSYKTVPTFDFGMPQKKFFKKLKIFGSPSAFWQPDNIPDDKYPLKFTPWSDFKPGQTVSFIHAHDGDSVSQKILKKHFSHRLGFHELTFDEQRKFWKLYKEEVDNITQISMPLIANPGTRFGLEMSMKMTEAYVDIYGFEIFFEPSQQIL